VLLRSARERQAAYSSLNGRKRLFSLYFFKYTFFAHFAQRFELAPSVPPTDLIKKRISDWAMSSNRRCFVHVGDNRSSTAAVAMAARSTIELVPHRRVS
jgi:hypothetical protein